MKKVVLALLRGYKKYISPCLPSACRFTPTCSEYAMEAVQEWGVFIGLILTTGRLLRCNPLFKGGYDPVPVRRRSVGRSTY
ncbi:MAG: membrane protein insertion efficiency factor YidD [Clostridia bacterium]|nr:membrane protein insertion efficiency factor YidD [Clostridia bacterium]MBQ9988244.1 membrane protein insertion efficiency factor YidD [Clostridia bacterium]